MHDLNDFRLFAYVVEEGSFAAAGRRLGVPRSQVSRRIQLLEDSFGLRLVHRTPHSFSVTDIGRSFYSHCQAMLTEAAAASAVIEAEKSEPQGVIRIACPPSMIALRLGDAVADFMAQCPKVTVLLESTNRRVDVLREGFDMAIRVRFPPLEDSELVIRKLGLDNQVLVAAPVCLGNTPCQSPADIADLPGLSWNPDLNTHHWDLIGPNGEKHRHSFTPRLLSQDMSVLVAAARRGLGLCQLPEIIARPLLASGELVEALPGWRPEAGIIHAAFPTRRGMLPSVRAFLDFIAQTFEKI